MRGWLINCVRTPYPPRGLLDGHAQRHARPLAGLGVDLERSVGLLRQLCDRRRAEVTLCASPLHLPRSETLAVVDDAQHRHAAVALQLHRDIACLRMRGDVAEDLL